MTVSRNNRVRFFLPNRYFQSGRRATNGFSRHTMVDVLRRAFDLTPTESDSLMEQFPRGFHIECRPSQFARFIVYRCEANEGINGIRDLEPTLTSPGKHPGPFERIAAELGLKPYIVRRIASMLVEIANASPGSVCVADRPAGAS